MLLSQYKFGAFLSLLILGFISFWLVNGYSVVSADSHPTVFSIELLNDNPTQDQELVFEITFSEEISGLDGGDFQVSTTGDIVGESIVSIDVADVVPGSVGTTVYTGTGLDDAIFSGEFNSTVQGCSMILGVDSLAPGNGLDNDTFIFGFQPGQGDCDVDDGIGDGEPISIEITPGIPQYLGGGVYVTFASGTGHTTIIMGEGFDNVWTADLIPGSGGAVYHVTVDRGTGSGTLHLAFLDDDTVIDVDENPVGGIGLSNGDFTTADAYIIPSMLGAGTEEDPYQITDCEQLQSMNEDLTAYYQLQNDIDCADTVNWNEGDGFVPVGDYDTPFTGSLDGNGYTISGLTITRADNNQGLFGAIGENGVVFDVTLSNFVIAVDTLELTTGSKVGSLAGLSMGTINNVLVLDALISGYGRIGGAIGTVVGGDISELVIQGDTTISSEDGDDVGGFAGEINTNAGASPIIIDSVYVDEGVSIYGYEASGGFAGLVFGQNLLIQNAGSQASVYVQDHMTGGFVGLLGAGARITTSFATGDVIYEGEESVESTGGFVGLVAMGGIIEDSFATGDVTGTDMVGGFAGFVGQLGDIPAGGGYIHRVYSTGAVTGNTNVGGLVGLESNNDGEITYAYWNMETSGQSTSSAGTGKTTAQMSNIDTYETWDMLELDEEFASPYPVLWTEEDSAAIWVIPVSEDVEEQPQPARRSSSGGSVQHMVSNLQNQGKTEQAEELKNQFPNLFDNETPTVESLTKKLVELQTLLQQLQSSSDSLSCTPSLKRGSTGEQVRILQTKLNIAPTDGIFGPQTEQAVRTFQSQKNLTVDGIAGRQTCSALLAR